jgi:prepilin-type N-terminal cleavage/methylation domain-containing protein
MLGKPCLRNRPALGAGGFTAIELLVVVAVIGIIMAASAPSLLSYLRTSRLRAGAEEMTTVLAQARQLAIKDATTMCVTNNGSRVQYRVGTCAGTVWTGPGTDSAGFIQLANNITVTAGQVTFSYIGTAPVAGTYTVADPHDGRTLSVVVASSGRISITP